MKTRHTLKPVYVCVLLVLTAQAALANPLNPAVVNGQASFATTGNALTVTNTPGTIINWQGFSIGANEITRFNQQSAVSAVLNRVISNNPSSILGALQSNGRVFLVNPNGIVFGAGATVDVAGLVASSLNLSNADFLAGRYSFTQVPGAANISNAGKLTAQTGGQIFLIAANVENTGVITAPNGEILLAAGHSVDLVNTSNPNLRVNITAPAGDATNVGQLIASAGSLGLFGTIVRNSGQVSADSATMQGGKIVFKASQRVEAGGTITANGTSGGNVAVSAAPSLDRNAPGVVIHTGSIQVQGTAGAGGAISLGGDNILTAAAINADGTSAGGLIDVQATGRAISTSSARYTANSMQGRGGDILVSANVSNYTSGTYTATGDVGGNLTLAGNEIKLSGPQLDASGTNGGGNIYVGGWMHGVAGFNAQGIALTNATNVLTNSSARFTANALQTGNGGQVVFWSDQTMRFKGSISAKGGALGGNGGMAEISGLTALGYGGLTDLSATHGLNGTLLLDPRNITIVAGAGALSGGAGGPSILELLDPTPGAGEGFGGAMTELSNGKIVVASPLDSFAALNAGAVYLYSATGTLVSTLTGSTANDKVGSGGVTELTGNGNFVVRSPLWNNGAATTAGAMTWSSGAAGVSGAVSFVNSLVGSHAGDGVGQELFVPYRNNQGLVTLPNGNYVVVSSEWNSGMGAVTWGNGASGTVGLVSGSNSLVGSGGGSFVGATGITVQTGGSNYVLQSPWFDYYDSSSASWLNDAGAVTWMNGTNGRLSDGTSFGAVSIANSLLGKFAYDNAGGVTALSNGNFVAGTPVWGGGVFGGGSKGAATWINGASGALMWGATGDVISSGNSLVGTASGDYVGSNILALPVNGNYVVSGSSAGTPTATWVNGTNGQTSNTGNTISSANSLMGASSPYALTNGNYVVVNGYYAGAGSQRGVATWVNGTTGLTSNSSNIISSANSIIGSTNKDMVGQNGVIALPNGNYVLQNFNWTYAAGGGWGAVTWVNGATGNTSNGSNVISQSNSVVGNYYGEQVGSRVVVLTNNNYVIGSYNWRGPDTGYATSGGAATWVNGSTGLTTDNSGLISQNNSLLGFNTSDMVGYNITALSNGNYVVGSPFWSGNKGAVTWGNGLTGTITSSVGFVGASNSLVGSASSDYVGAPDYLGGNNVFALPGGNYVIGSGYWNGHAGAVTWGNGATAGTRLTGTISSANSIVGAAGQTLGYYPPAILSNGNYVVGNSKWNGNRGVVTWVNGGNGQVSDYVANGNTNIVSAANSLVGSTAGDYVGSGGVTQLGNGNYAVSSYLWNNGAATSAGAVTWANSLGTTVGAVSASNSLVGSTAGENLGTYVMALKQGANLGNAYVGSSNANAGAGRAFILGAPVAGTATGTLFTNTPATDVTIGAGNIAATLNLGTNVLLQANNDITQNTDAGITATGLGNLTLQAGRSVVLGDVIHIDGALDITANDAGITAAEKAAIAANRSAGTAVLDTSLATLTAGSINLTNSGGDILAGAITANTGALTATGGVTINGNVSVGAVAVSAPTFTLSGGTWNQVSATLPGFTVNDFRIASGTFIRALGGDGGVAPYQLTDIYGVQGMGSTGMLNKSYVLANNIDASGTSNWNAGAGFVPVGSGYYSAFTGQFDGLNHTISNLTTINIAQYEGLFGVVGVGGIVSNVGLIGSSVIGACSDCSGVTGALAGYNQGIISNSYASNGSVSVGSKIGGLVGWNAGAIINTYASGGTVGGGDSLTSGIGGLVGYNSGTISKSYATSNVSGSNNVGGLVGFNSGTVSNSFWDTQTSGQTSSVAGTGMTSAQMQQQANFTSSATANGNVNPNWDFAGTWVMYDGHTYPLLRSFMTQLTVMANHDTKTYDGQAYSGGNGVSYSSPPNANLLGAVSYIGTSQGAINSGNYVITPGGLYSNQQGYILSYVDGALTVNPASATTPVVPQPVISSLVSMSIPAINIPFNPPVPPVLMQAPTIDEINLLGPTAAGSDNPDDQAARDAAAAGTTSVTVAEAAPLLVCR